MPENLLIPAHAVLAQARFGESGRLPEEGTEEGRQETSEKAVYWEWALHFQRDIL